MSVARFTKGDSVATTNRTTFSGKRSNPPKPGGRSASGMPGYIKTGTDKSSGDMRKGRGDVGMVNGPKAIPVRKGPDRSTIQSANTARGSMDMNYKATSTNPPGKVRPTTGPMAPAKRNLSSNTDGARPKLAKGGLSAGRTPSLKSAKYGQGKGGSTRGNGTMEKLAGKVRFSKNMTSARKSMMY